MRKFINIDDTIINLADVRKVKKTTGTKICFDLEGNQYKEYVPCLEITVHTKTNITTYYKYFNNKLQRWLFCKRYFK